MKFEFVIPVSPEQEDVIFDHVFYGAELGVLPDEKAWVYRMFRRTHPKATLTRNELDITTCTWKLTLEVPDEA